MPIHNPPKEIHQEEDRFTTVICQSELERTLRDGARRLLKSALEAEVEEYIQRHQSVRDEDGRRLVVRNGYGASRNLQTGLGAIEVQAPRVNDRRDDEHFTSRILPPYLRRTPSLENLIPILYLKGVSTSAMPEALAPLLGANAAGLSAATVVRLIESWQDDYQAWLKRDLSGAPFVYLWADGIYCNVRLTDDRPCLLVIVGARADGTKELVALADGERESEQSWLGVLRDIKARGVKIPPRLAVIERSAAVNKLHAHITPGEYSWIGTSSGIRGLNFNYVVTQDECGAELYIDRGKDAEAENKAIFDQLFAHKGEIDQAFGETLSWERMEGRRGCRIRHTQRGGGYRSPEGQWPALQDAIIKDMDRLEKTLRPYLKQLKLNM